MIVPPLPANEEQRLAAIESYRLGGLGREPAFDRITKLAAALFDVPMALVSIVGSDMQCFRGACGMDSSGTERDIAFCAFAILGEDVMVVPDATKDERFHDNPLVIGDPHVRFYAGAPLRVDGDVALGTLCLIDSKPREFGADDRHNLEMLAATVIDLIELRVGSLVADEQVASLNQQQARLQDLSARQEAIFDAATDGMMTIDGHGTMLSVNPATATMFGRDKDGMVGASIATLFETPPSPAELSAFLSRLAEKQANGGERRRYEVTGKRTDGRVFTVDVAASLIPTSGPTQFVAVIRDISERKRVEEMKSEFVATVSHELRTPLTSISGSLGLVCGGAAGEMPHRAKRLIEIAHTNSKRLVRLINDILDVEKIESGKATLDIQPTPLIPLLDQVIDATNAFAEGYGVQLALVGDPGEMTVLADHDRLAQVVTNLLSNAAKFSPAGSKVEVSVERLGQRCRITVADRGSGIPEAFRARIFSRFAQADSSDSRQKGGTGLGLSIVRELATRMGGSVGFEDREGGGTCFHVDLPLDPQAVPELRVLIGDADSDGAQAVQASLEKAGYASDIATTPDEVRQLTERKGYAAILLDLAMTGGEAAHLIRHLRSRRDYGSVPILVAAAEGRDGHISPPLVVANWLEGVPSADALVRELDLAVRTAPGEKPCILHVEDDADVRSLVSSAFDGRADFQSVTTAEAARKALVDREFDLVILDLGLPGASGIELLPEMRRRDGRPIPVVIFSAQDDDPALARQVDAMLTKSRVSLQDLVRTVESVISRGSAAAFKESA